VVLDTNVLVSAVLTAHGACSRIVDLLVEGELDLYADDRILAEYTSVLERPELRIDPHDAAVLLELIRSVAHLVSGAPLSVQLPDPEDSAFLEAAAASQSILITGNTRHFPKGSRAGVKVLTPREFLEQLRSTHQ
jgi:putative PIN family toxin of toxin-antitoxin system